MFGGPVALFAAKLTTIFNRLLLVHFYAAQIVGSAPIQKSLNFKVMHSVIAYLIQIIANAKHFLSFYLSLSLSPFAAQIIVVSSMRHIVLHIHFDGSFPLCVSLSLPLSSLFK